jgi:hypothetical protein
MRTSVNENCFASALIASLLFAGVCIAGAAQPATSPGQGNGGGANDKKGTKRPPVEQNRYPLGLPRLSDRHSAPLNAKKVVVDPLQVPAGATGTRKQSQQGVEYLEFDPAKSWSHVLRGNPKEVVFVSFCANASLGTEFEIGGALLRVTASKEAGKAQVQARHRDAAGKDQWRSVGLRARTDIFNNRALAPLPVFTVRLDPAAGVWDFYLGTVQLAAGLPLITENNAKDRKFRLRSGANGAQLCALIIARDNPLFVDANLNGIDDAFELQTKGALLSKASPDADVKAVAKAWHDAQKGKSGGSIGAKRPAPDRVALVAKSK